MPNQMELMEAYVKLSVQGEDKVQESLNKQKLSVDRLLSSIQSGAYANFVAQNEAIARAMERARAAAMPAQGGPGIMSRLGGAASAGFMAAGQGGAMGLLGAMGGPGAAIAAGLGAVKNLAGAADPVAMERFNYVLKDVNAVLGRVFVPVLNLASQGLRIIGDVLANLLPSAEEMEEMFKPLGDILKTLGEAVMPMAQVIRAVLVSAIQSLAVVLRDLAVWIASIMPDALDERKMAMKEWDKVEAEQRDGKRYDTRRDDITDEQRNPAWRKTMYQQYVEEGKKQGISARDAFEKKLKDHKIPGFESSQGAGQFAPAQFTDPMSYYRQISQQALNMGRESPQEQLVKEAQRHTQLLEELRDRLGIMQPAVGA